MSTRYYEDFEIGETDEYGSRTLTKDDIVGFARQYDPQPFHVDEDAAAESPFGGLVASGWQTVAVCQRMLIECRLETASRGGRGVDELRWHKPVRPEDTLSITTEVVDKRPSESTPEMGYIDMTVTGENQDGETVVSWIVLGMLERREPE